MACLAAGLLSFASLAEAGQRQTIKQHLPPNARAHPVGLLPADTRLNISIALPLRNTEALSKFLEQIYDPASTNYHGYLTPAEFAQRFGPTESDYQALITFARSHDLTVTVTHPNRTLLELRGTVADLQKAFG